MHMASFHAHEMISCTRNHFMHRTSFHDHNNVSKQNVPSEQEICRQRDNTVVSLQTVGPDAKTNQ